MFKRKVKLVKYPEPMSMPEVGNVFRDQGEGSKIWQALDTIIDNHLLDAVNEVSDSKLSTQQLSHASGRIDAISSLKARMEEFKIWKTGKTNYKNS